MEQLIKTGNDLLDENQFNISKLKLWKIQGVRVLESEYDSELAKEFERTLSSGSVFRMGSSESEMFRDVYQPKIKRGLDFLESLQAMELPEKKADDPSLPESLRTITVKNGTVIFGNNNTANHVTVKDLLLTLEKDITANAKPGTDKTSALSAVKNLTTNETVAAVIGQTLGAFLSHMK